MGFGGGRLRRVVSTDPLASLAARPPVRRSPRWLRSERQRASRNHSVRVSTGSTGVGSGRCPATASGLDDHSLRSLLDHLVRRSLRWLRSERERASRNHSVRVSTGSTAWASGRWPAYGGWSRRSLASLAARPPGTTLPSVVEERAPASVSKHRGQGFDRLNRRGLRSVVGLRQVVSTDHSLRSLLDHLVRRSLGG